MNGRSATTEFLYWPAAGNDAPAHIGGKATGLLAVGRAGLVTPPWFAIPSTAWLAGTALESRQAAEVQSACEGLRDAGWGAFAVRSSAGEEDSTTHSFAGQYLSRLNVSSIDDVLAAIEACRTSAHAPTAVAYRRALGISDEPTGMAVIVQGLVDASVSGVAFSRAPDGRDGSCIVSAARGLGAPLVSGAIDGDEYRITADGAVEVRRLGIQPNRMVAADGGGTVMEPVPPSEADQRVLDDDQAREIAAAARRLATARGTEQDVEWAYDRDGCLWILQSRPITTLAKHAGNEPVRIWDNSNIVESFADVTLPLTFSVAREAYEAAYLSTARALGVPKRSVEEQRPLFGQMLGHWQGRVYYNVSSWHELLALLPGFSHNQRFMERMMGAARPPQERSRTGSLLRQVPIAFRLAVSWLRFEGRALAFERRVDALLAEVADRDLAELGANELLETFESVSRRALASWHTTIVNDICLMVFHGLLRSRADEWLGDDATPLINASLRGSDLASAQPAAELGLLAEQLRGQPSWMRAVADATDASLLERIRSDPQLQEVSDALDRYLDRWGDRSPDELQLDRPTYRDDPVPLVAVLRGLSRAGAAPRSQHLPLATDDLRLRLVERGQRSAVWREPFLRFLIDRTRFHLAWRERMRLARGRVFGVGRRIFGALGVRLTESELIDDSSDIHYLDVQELRWLLRTTGSLPGSAREVVRARRAQFAAYRRSPPPPDRFEEVGMEIVPAPPPAAGSETGQLVGVGAAPGRVHGAVIVVRRPDLGHDVAGRIVAARSTDPGWPPLMISAAGLLVERGSLLSHSAIVARELRLPTIVGIPNLLERLPDGALVEMDGGTGVVRLHASTEDR